MVYFPYMFSVHMWKTYRLNRDMHCFFFPHVENIRNRTCSIPYAFFSISFGQSEESSNEVNCLLTDNAKILISELYYYIVYFSRIAL